MMRAIYIPSLFGIVMLLGVGGCVGPTPGPDKAGEQMMLGAASGAGSGAITGAKLGASSGAGVLIGAGIGATTGFIRGLGQDQFEERLLLMSRELRKEREVAFAQQVLAEHYQRRQELHPSRDIFPTELFFRGDESELRTTAYPILRELVRMNKERLSWSRVAVTSYVRSNEEETHFSSHLASERAEKIGDAFVRLGLEPRRIVARSMIVDQPILIDPNDRADRYNQAIELTPLDR